MFKTLVITSILLSAIYADDSNIKKLYYDDIDSSNFTTSQEKINSTYLFGIEILKSSLIHIKKNSNITDAKSLYEECDESLYLAIFDRTIVDKLGRSTSFKKFENDCKTIAKQLFK